MLDNFVDPIPSLQDVKNQSEKFETHAGTALKYEKYSELFLSAATNHNNKFNLSTKFVSKSRRSFYELEQLPDDGYDATFDIYVSVYIIQAYTSYQ